MASRPCARPGPAPWVPCSDPVFHRCGRTAREGEVPPGSPADPGMEWAAGDAGEPGRQAAWVPVPALALACGKTLRFPVRKQLISVKNAPFHPQGRLLANRQGGRQPGWEASAGHSCPARGVRPAGEAPPGGCRGLPAFTGGKGVRGPRRPRRLEEPRGYPPRRPHLPPRSSGTQGPSPHPGSRTEVGGRVWERLQGQQRCCPATQAPPGPPAAPSPVGEGLQMTGSTGSPSGAAGGMGCSMGG